jgi:putative membrane protein
MHPATETALAHAVHRWSSDPVVLASLAATALLYFRGLRRLWARAGVGSGIGRWQAASFAGGWVALVVALVSPVDAVSDFLFSVHMTQHEILMLVAAPLVVLGRPLVAFHWALPAGARERTGAWTRRPAVGRGWRILTGALVVWALHAIALWVWHVPRLFEAALANDGIHAFQHLCFLLTATLFWWTLVHGRYGRLGYGAAVLYVFTTGVHSTLLGALLTLAPATWYASYRARAPQAGVNALADQQLAGLLMWVPFGVVFAVIGLALFAAWLGEAGRRVRYTSAEARAPLSGPGAAGGLLVVLLAMLFSAGCEDHETKGQAARLTGGDPDRGAGAIRRFGCNSCHRIPGIRGADGLVGPPLDAIASRTYIAGRRANTPEEMMDFIAHPHGTDRQTAMPEMGIPQRDVRDIAAYLYTLK